MSRRLHVGNLPLGTTDEDLRELFSLYGAVTTVGVVIDKNTGRSRGFGFVEMEDGVDAAIRATHGTASGADDRGERRPAAGGSPDGRRRRHAGETSRLISLDRPNSPRHRRSWNGIANAAPPAGTHQCGFTAVQKTARTERGEAGNAGPRALREAVRLASAEIVRAGSGDRQGRRHRSQMTIRTTPANQRTRPSPVTHTVGWTAGGSVSIRRRRSRRSSAGTACG